MEFMDVKDEQAAPKAASTASRESHTLVSDTLVITPPSTLKSTKARSPHLSERVTRAYNNTGRSLALVLSLAIAVALWVAGAYFTLSFLSSMGISLAAAGLAAWLIPLGITAAELFLWPKADTRWQEILMFLAILAVDLGTSWRGFIAWGAGRDIPLFTGFTLPEAGWQLHVIALIIGLILAFAPEKVGRWALTELFRIWR